MLFNTDSSQTNFDGYVQLTGSFQDESLDSNLSELSPLVDATNYTGKKGTNVIGAIGGMPTILIGLGKRDDFSLAVLRKELADAVSIIKGVRRTKVLIRFADMLVLLNETHFQIGEAIANVLVVTNYKGYSEKTTTAELTCEIEEVAFAESLNIDFVNGINSGAAIGEGTNLARYLIAAPSNFMTPVQIHKQAVLLVQRYPEANLELNLYDVDQLQQMGAGGILAVNAGSGSLYQANFVELIYSPPNAKRKLAYVGKTVCFDSGGQNIKTNAASIAMMKVDMGGGGTVLGAFEAIVALGLPIAVRVVLPAVMNMTGGNAIQPGSVITSLSGKTIEVYNTDAEGRLTLADGLHYVRDDEIALTIATLTGAAAVITGYAGSPIFCRDRETLDIILESSRNQGEFLQPLELRPEYREMNKSSIADIRNAGRGAGCCTAADFVNFFSAEGQTHIHIDIAGTVWTESNRITWKPRGGASGFGVATLVDFARSLSAA